MNGIATAGRHPCCGTCIQAEIRTRKASIAEKEAALAANNPPLFQQIQVRGSQQSSLEDSDPFLLTIIEERVVLAFGVYYKHFVIAHAACGPQHRGLKQSFCVAKQIRTGACAQHSA